MPRGLTDREHKFLQEVLRPEDEIRYRNLVESRTTALLTVGYSNSQQEHIDSCDRVLLKILFDHGLLTQESFTASLMEGKWN